MLARKLRAMGSATPSFVASAQTQNVSSGTSLVINRPTGTQSGDIMVAVMATDVVNVTWTGDTSWNEVADQGAVPSLRIAYKVAGGSEPASYTFTANSSALLAGCILTYRSAAYDTIGGSFASGTDPLVLSSISPSVGPAILLAVGARSLENITLGTPSGMTARVTDNDATNPSFIVCEQQVTAGATGTRSMSTGSVSRAAGILLALKPS